MAKATIIYDDYCDMCTRTLAFVRCMDWLSRMDACPASLADERHPGSLAGGLDLGVRLVLGGGQVLIGIDAVRSIMARTPLGALVAWALWIPPVRAATKRLYDRIAARRSTSCSLQMRRG
jgi:predicted DCC family thiol-disulfide oxidoreductase YuxK